MSHNQKEASELMAQLGASILRDMGDGIPRKRTAYRNNLRWGMWNLRGQP